LQFCWLCSHHADISVASPFQLQPWCFNIQITSQLQFTISNSNLAATPASPISQHHHFTSNQIPKPATPNQSNNKFTKSSHPCQTRTQTAFSSSPRPITQAPHLQSLAVPLSLSTKPGKFQSTHNHIFTNVHHTSFIHGKPSPNHFIK
jgi:hypothetical protein